jgi:photosystem II stability/assembly factor-like uncharacterized protein
MSSPSRISARWLLVALVVIGICAPSARAGVGPGWTWQNPTPLGRVTRGIASAGANTYAIGDDGSLLRSSDGGAHWTVLMASASERVHRVEVVDESTLVVGTGACHTLFSRDAGRTFTPIFNSLGGKCDAVAAFSFVSPSEGFLLLTNGGVERTVDGGQTFSAVAPIPGTPSVLGIEDERRFATYEGLGAEIYFRSASLGMAFVTPTEGPSTAFTTSDSGASWSPVPLPPDSRVARVNFVDGVAYAVGPGTLLYSGDGGASWQALQVPFSVTPEAVFCTNVDRCLLKWSLTASLSELEGATSSVPAREVRVPLCLVGDRPPMQILSLPDGSNSESGSLVSGEAAESCPLQSAEAQLETNELTQGAGTLVYAFPGTTSFELSTDEGADWRSIVTPGPAAVVDAAFFDARHGFTLDSEGRLRETSDGGASWQTLRPRTHGTPRAVTVLGRHVVLVLEATGIRRSQNDGAFEPVGGPLVRGARLVAFDQVGSTIFAYGGRWLLRSTDGGSRWTRLPLPPSAGAGRIGDISFVSPVRGYALGSETLWFTQDAGKHWQAMLSTGVNGLESVRFVNARDGYLTGEIYFTDQDSTYVLHTTDGGATWSPEYVGPGWISSEVAAAGSQAALVLQEPNTGISGTMFYHAASEGHAGIPLARIRLHASQRTVTGRQLLADHGAAPVTISGTLSTGAAGQQVIISHRNLQGEPFWDERTVTTGAGGRFTTKWRVGSSSVFVAQWLGGHHQTGAGSRALTIFTPSL